MDDGYDTQSRCIIDSRIVVEYSFCIHVKNSEILQLAQYYAFQWTSKLICSIRTEQTYNTSIFTELYQII